MRSHKRCAGKNNTEEKTLYSCAPYFSMLQLCDDAGGFSNTEHIGHKVESLTLSEYV